MPLKESRDERVLGIEMAIEGTCAQFGPGKNLGDSQRPHALFVNDRMCRGEDRLPDLWIRFEPRAPPVGRVRTRD